MSTPVAALHNLLAPRELELGAAHGLLGLQVRETRPVGSAVFHHWQNGGSDGMRLLRTGCPGQTSGQGCTLYECEPYRYCICMHAKQFSCEAAGNTCRCDVRVLAADGQQDLPNGHARGSSQRLTKCAAHACLQMVHPQADLISLRQSAHGCPWVALGASSETPCPCMTRQHHDVILQGCSRLILQAYK